MSSTSNSNRRRTAITSLAVFIAVGHSIGQASIFDEEFDDDGNGSRYTLSTQFNNHAQGYFDLVWIWSRTRS